jgi:hypothetical protein
MFLHFHGKYNMILFVLEIFNHIQIKQLIPFVFFLLFLTIKENIQKKNKTPTTTTFLLYSFCYMFTE